MTKTDASFFAALFVVLSTFVAALVLCSYDYAQGREPPAMVINFLFFVLALSANTLGFHIATNGGIPNIPILKQAVAKRTFHTQDTRPFDAL